MLVVWPMSAQASCLLRCGYVGDPGGMERLHGRGCTAGAAHMALLEGLLVVTVHAVTGGGVALL